jgi:hypothetical protein
MPENRRPPTAPPTHSSVLALEQSAYREDTCLTSPSFFLFPKSGIVLEMMQKQGKKASKFGIFLRTWFSAPANDFSRIALVCP